MKFLLTSNGLSNKSITRELLRLAGKPAKQLKVAFIPTAAHAETDDKTWLIDDLVNINNAGFKAISIVDISAIPKKIWEPQLRSANILIFCGGNTLHLLYWLRKSGLDKMLPELLRRRVYVGISAGSIVTCPRMDLSGARTYKMDGKLLTRADKGLGFVEFGFRPHLNSPDFSFSSEKNLARIAKKIPFMFYGMDDMGAVSVDGLKMKVVSEGKWKVFNERTV